MTTAREVINAALTFHLNRLSPGETADPDTANVCLTALNFIADEWNGQKSFLFREILSAGTVTGSTGTLGSTWSALSPGDQILGVTYSNNQDICLEELTMRQYHEIADKTVSGDPSWWAHDGLSTLYFYPVPTSRSITLRTKQKVSDFADLDTNYSMPNGYKSGIAAELAEKIAPTMLGSVPVTVSIAARQARNRLRAQAVVPAILDSSFRRANILTG